MQRNPLAQQVVMLRHSRRFGEGSGIGQLARLVNRQDAYAARNLLASRPTTCSAWRSSTSRTVLRPPAARRPQPRRRRPAGLSQLPAHPWPLRPPLETAADDPLGAVGRQVLHSFEDFQLLCAVRKGAWGVEGLNQRVARVLHNAGLIDSQQLWYEGARCW
jgi:exodeoxyribonuclease V alpha subunit